VISLFLASEPIETFNEELMLSMVAECLHLILVLSAPMLLAAIIAGVAVACFQAATQIQEQTLSFVPKIVLTFWAVLHYGENICHEVAGFTSRMLDYIQYMGPHR
jgi:flagellar biosynthetic protein FliQ